MFDRYFHKVPEEAPALELKASYGLAEPLTYELPPLSSQCTPEVYATFDLTRGAKDDKVQIELLSVTAISLMLVAIGSLVV